MAPSNLTKIPTVILFFLFLLFPLFAQVTGQPRIAPLEEYRKLAERPVVADYFGGGKADFLGFTEKLNSWYSDQFATRPFWVRLYTQTLYSVFRESDLVHVGPYNWLYYRSVLDVETPQLDRIAQEGRKSMIDKFARLTSLLEQRGVTLYVMPLTLKHRYYPEYLPLDAQHAKYFKYYDTFMDELAADGRVHLVDPRKALLDAKASGLKVYHKTDFHWTDAAAPLAIKPVLEDIGRREGKESFAGSWDYQVVIQKSISGGQARALPLFRTPTEDSPAVKFNGPLTIFTEQTITPGSEWSGVAREGQPGRFEPILVYGDSFFDAETRSGFFNFFRAFSRARVWQQDLTDAYRNRPTGTRYLVIEYISSATLGIDNYITAFIKALEQDPAM